MKTQQWLPLVALLSMGAMCGGLFGGGDSADITKSADEILKSGDLPGALSEYDKLQKENPDSVYAAQGAAYAHLLTGDYDGADKLLAGAEDKAKDNQELKDEVLLRRALVALAGVPTDDKYIDQVSKYGKASHKPAGQLLAGEVELLSLNPQEAEVLFKEAAKDSGVVGETAKQYLELIANETSSIQLLADGNAVWALGKRADAIDRVGESLKELPEDYPNRAEIVLMWAGRAVTSGKPDVATGLIDSMGAPPDGQAWRMNAMLAIIQIAEGNNEAGLNTFNVLKEGGAPADGMIDALATAAAVCKDPETVKKLVGPDDSIAKAIGGAESAAVARGLAEAGLNDEAKRAAPEGALKKYLEAQ
jgi:tetratricopeptide (TPR) repeat protein